jgi:hypothetical protein
MDTSLKIFSVRKTRNIRVLTVFSALFLSLYLGFLLPSHHHDDGQEHEDCSLCVAQVQPSLAEFTFSMPVPVVVTSEAVLQPACICKPSIVTGYQTRAPPA